MELEEGCIELHPDLKAVNQSDDELERLRARVAELEAERDAWRDKCTIQAAPVQLTAEQAEKADEAIREALGDAYDCLRVCNAWSYGTMGTYDFSRVAEDPDRVADIRNAAAAALGFNVES